MAKDSIPLSIADLERVLDERRDQLQTLLKRREQAQKDLEKLDAEIQKSLTPNTGTRRIRHRVKNETSLRAAVTGILAKNKKGFSLPDLANKVAETGYKSNSRNFKNVLYQCLYNTGSVVHDETTGCYRIER